MITNILQNQNQEKSVNMRITLSDIAKEVGISIATVSRAVNPETSSKVKPATIAKINEAMNKLGYIPDSEIIKKIPTENSIAVILTGTKSFSHYLFAEMMDFLQACVHNSNYKLRYVIAESSVSKEKFRQIISESPVSGAVILGPVTDDTFAFLKSKIANLIYTGVNSTRYDIDEVICNGAKSITSLYEHFYSIGYRKIAYIGPVVKTANNSVVHPRYISYLKSLASKKIEVDMSMVQASYDTTEEGYTAMYRMINNESLPDAIICAGDNIAIGVIRAAKENNVSIPKDIAIVGMDNIKMAQYLTPSLTTINVPKKDLSSLAIKMLIDRIEGKSSSVSIVEMPFDIIIRESCGYNRRDKKI